jgi:serine/threonine protein kinase
LVTTPSARERFLREGHLARDLRHENIIAVYDVNEAEGQVYVVMEDVPGETLRNRLLGTLHDGKDISFDSARQIIRDILSGLQAAHASGVIHRDLKPESIMLRGNPGEKDYKLKILDFGIARALGDKATQQLTTSTATWNPLYIAPEQKTAPDSVGPPADLYAVSAIFYELLLGVAPSGRWVPPSQERPDLPSGLDAVIEKGLSSRPRSRYENVAEYLAALEKVGITPPPPVPDPPKPPPKPPRPARNRKRTFATVAAVVFGLWVLGMIGERINRTPPSSAVVSLPGNDRAADVPDDQRTAIDNNDSTAPQISRENSPSGSDRAGDVPPQEPVVPVANLGDQWFDELSGTGIASARVVLQQSNNMVSGTIFNAQDLQLGTLSGQVNGNILEYNYYSPLMGTGSGRGALDADGQHMRILVNGVESHTLHRNHLPGQ